eukprot:scpid23152/ scgid26543/ 
MVQAGQVGVFWAEMISSASNYQYSSSSRDPLAGGASCRSSSSGGCVQPVSPFVAFRLSSSGCMYGDYAQAASYCTTSLLALCTATLCNCEGYPSTLHCVSMLRYPGTSTQSLHHCWCRSQELLLLSRDQSSKQSIPSGRLSLEVAGIDCRPWPGAISLLVLVYDDCDSLKLNYLHF